jgi:hypothetical protein
MAWREQLNVGELTVNEIILSSVRNSDQTVGFLISSDDLTTGFQVSGDVTYAFKSNNGAMKLHVHNRSTQSYAAEIKYDWQAVTGLAFGIDCTCEVEPGGDTPANRTSGGLRAVQGVARLQSGFTSTAGTEIGVYGSVINEGIYNGGSNYIACLYGLLQGSGTFTQVGEMSVAWLDSHLNQAVSAGSAFFLNITNNGATNFDAAINVRAGHNITNLLQISTASGMVGANVNADATFDNYKTIKIDLDGTTHYLIAAQTIS